MRLVVIESPYAGEVEANVAYAKRCVRDCLKRGEAPYASHLFFTQDGILDDLKPVERKLGIEAGFAWGTAAAVVCFYVDRGWSKGMKLGYLAAITRGSPIELRSFEREIDMQEYVALHAELTGRGCPDCGGSDQTHAMRCSIGGAAATPHMSNPEGEKR